MTQLVTTTRINPPCLFCCRDTGIRNDASHNHVNWGWVTMTGTIYYKEYAGGLEGDDDFNLELISDNRTVLTPGNHYTQGGITAVDLEFKKGETVDQMGSEFWYQFKNADDPGRRALI